MTLAKEHGEVRRNVATDGAWQDRPHPEPTGCPLPPEPTPALGQPVPTGRQGRPGVPTRSRSYFTRTSAPCRHRRGHAGSRSTPLCNTRKLTLAKGRDAGSRIGSPPSTLKGREGLTGQPMIQVTTDLKVIDSHAARKERQQNGQPQGSVQLCANPSERQITPNFVEQPASHWPPRQRREQTAKPAGTRTGW